MGIADRVKLPGGVPWSELQEVYRAHDVFVLASARDAHLARAVRLRA